MGGMKLLNFVAVACLAAAFTVQAKPLRVLAIGNSYTQSLEPELPRLAAAAGMETVRAQPKTGK